MLVEFTPMATWNQGVGTERESLLVVQFQEWPFGGVGGAIPVNCPVRSRRLTI